jgi:ABC-2 type transport system ATP-binding protein
MTTHYIEEAQNAADRIAVIDHGKIVAMGTTKELEKLTGTKSLEEAYLALTGREVRDEGAEQGRDMRMRSRRR